MTILVRSLLLKLVKRLRLVLLRETCWQIDWQADRHTYKKQIDKSKQRHITEDRQTDRHRRKGPISYRSENVVVHRFCPDNLQSCSSSPRITHLPKHLMHKLLCFYLSTQPKSSWSEGALVSRAGVLVGGDGHQLQDPLSPSPVHPTRSKVNQDQVVVRST